VGLTVLLARRITAPMEHLREVARGIGSGRLDLRADVGGTVEVTELGQAFNAMLDEIHRSHLELVDRAADMTMANAQLVSEVEERRKAEEALRRSEERYALAARAANDGLWDWDVETGEVYYSPRWKAMLGLRDEEVGGRIEDWLSRVHPDDAPRLRQEIDDHLKGRTEQLHSLYRMAHPCDGVRWMLCRALTVRDERARPLRLAGSQADVTGQKRAEERLVHDALHDALTGLPNRSLFMDRLDHAVSLAAQRAARRGGRGFGVLFIDLDRFKLVNDTLGHAVGDHLLIEVARRITTCLRPGDTAARFGGDEFAILLEDIEAVADAEAIAERVVAQIGEPLPISGQTLYPGASVGVVVEGAQSRPAEEILRNADIAMYRAKSAGGRHAVFDASMHAEAAERLSLESELRRALEKREFELHYQPILDIASGGIRGFEALLRWRHPTRGIVPPEEFISVLEETRLIGPVGRWLLEEACRQAGRWQADGPVPGGVPVSVNVSSVQFAQPSFVQVVREALSTTGLSPWRLALEITESVLVGNPEAAARMLEELHGLGVRIHLDDFGTGYSSLAYLARFPIDCVKIDRSFVSRMKHHRADMEVVRAIAAIARNLDMEVIGEGIESPDEAVSLISAGCHLGQGWLYSRALPPDEASRLLGSREVPQPPWNRLESAR
jgi:diguanylate cyclase (GGDEF)-like protein/PAS domain S-box-containing protein